MQASELQVASQQIKSCEPNSCELIDKRIKLPFLKILRRLIFTNEMLSHSGQKICFREFKVLTFKIVCIHFIFVHLNLFSVEN